MQGSGQQAIESVAESGDHEDGQRPQISPLDQMDHDEGNKNHAQQRELVGRREELREPHARSFAVCEGERPSASEAASWSGRRGFGASATEGSSPVFATKRCDREGRLPSGESSSTRSMRCMGKKTTAGVKGSPFFTSNVRSSKEASSAPLRLRPSPSRERIIPQNFSRGLLRVTMTTAPG